MNTKKRQIYDLNIKKNRFYIGLHEKTLLEDESNWWTPCYWYPLKKIKEDIPVLFFNADYFDNGDRLETLKEIFINHNISSVTVIPELEDDYIEDDFPSRIVEQDEDGYTFPYFSERFIYDNMKDWMIYTSHEFTIAFAGKWLTEEMCKNFIRNEAKNE